jgi:hypothetical protein
VRRNFPNDSLKTPAIYRSSHSYSQQHSWLSNPSRHRTKPLTEEKEKVRLELESALEKDEMPLINDLRKVGVNVSSAWDLVDTHKSFKKAIPVLIENLSKPYHSKNKEGIVRALAVKTLIHTCLKETLERVPDHRNKRPF